MARKDLENLPVSGKGFERFFTTSTLLHIVAVIGMYFFITTSIRVIDEYREWAQAKQQSEEQRKRDEAQAEEELAFGIQEIIRERLENPTEEQIEELKEQVLEQLKDKEETKELLEELVEQIEKERDENPSENQPEEEEPEEPGELAPPEPKSGESREVEEEDLEGEGPQQGEAEENEPAELPPLEPETAKKEKDIKQEDLPDNPLLKLTEMVDALLPDAVKRVKRERKEDELVKKVIFEDLPEIENKLDNALKKKELEEHLKDALKELARDVAKNTYDELRELNKELIKEFRKTKEKEKKDKLRKLNKEVIALNKERSRAVKEIQKALNAARPPEGKPDHRQAESVKKAQKLADVAKRTLNNVKKLDPAKKSLGEKLAKHEQKREQFEQLVAELAKLQQNFFQENHQALKKAIKENAKQKAIERAAEELAMLAQESEQLAGLSPLEQEEEKKKAKKKLSRKVEEELEKLEEELEALEQEAKEAELAGLDQGEETEGVEGEGGQGEGEKKGLTKVPENIQFSEGPEGGGQEEHKPKSGEGNEPGGAGLEVPGIKAGGESADAGGGEEEAESNKTEETEGGEGNEKGAGVELPGSGELGGQSKTAGKSVAEEGSNEEGEKKPEKFGEGNEKGGGVELPGSGEEGGVSLTPGESTGTEGSNESGEPEPKTPGEGNEKGGGLPLPGNSEQGGASPAAGEDQGGEGPAAGEEGETPGEGGAGQGGDTFAPGEGAGEGQGSGGAGNQKGTFGNAKEYNPGVAGTMTDEEEKKESDPVEQKAAEITKEFPKLVETLADQTAVIPAEQSVVTLQEGDETKTGGGGDAESESSISLKADEIGNPVLLFQSPGTLGVKQDVRRDITERNLWLKVPDAPPALAFARPTTIGKLNRSKLPKPAAEIYVGDIKKRDVHHLDPNRDRRRHPNFPTGTYASIPYLVQAPAIDGDEADWTSYPTITHLGKLDNETPRSVYMGWRPEGLYLLAKVRDKVPGWKPNPSKKLFWRFECIEFWFDMKNAKAENTRKEDCQQFFIWPALTGLRRNAELHEIIWSDDSRERDPDWISEGEIRLQDDGRKGLIASIEHADHKGYTLEMYLPRALLRNLNFFKAGQVLGFHYLINHGFMTREQQYDGNLIEPFIQPYKHMKFHYSSHPNSWGNLQLLGTDAYVNILRPDGKVNEYPIVEVSKALGIQVLDADSDQDAATRDHVTVRVRNRYGFDGRKKDKQGRALGDWEDLLLTETSKSTGVFEGWIPTTVMPSRNNDQKLGVQIGDTIDVYYNDYVKSAGEYDKRINAEVKVVAPVYIVEGGKRHAKSGK